MPPRKLHKSAGGYLNQSQPLAQVTLSLVGGHRLRGVNPYPKIETVMPWEIDAFRTDGGGLGEMQCYPASLDGKASHRTASWVIGAMAATFAGCRVRMQLCGADVSPAHAVEYIAFEGNDQGCAVKVAVCGGVWFHAAPFPHHEKNRSLLVEQFTDGFTHVYGPGSERILI